jgi:hypothetical protein
MAAVADGDYGNPQELWALDEDNSGITDSVPATVFANQKGFHRDVNLFHFMSFIHKYYLRTLHTTFTIEKSRWVVSQPLY